MQVPEGWSLVVADDVCEKITKGTTPPKNDVLEVGDIPFLRVNNLSFTGKLLKSSEFIFVKKSSHEGFLARSVAYPNDILMNIVGPPLGKISLLDATYPEYNMNQAIVFFRSKVDSINSIFFLNYLYSHKTQSWLDRNSKKTSGQQNLTIEACKNIPILLPPLKEQQKIAQILSTWDKAITTTEQLLTNSQQQKKALMQQLLTGKKRLLDDNGQRFSGEWKQVMLKKIAKIAKGRALSSRNLIEGNYPVIAGGKTSPYSHNAFTHENIITVSASGAYAGYVSYHPYKIWASDCSVVEAKEKNTLVFIFYLLEHKQQRIYSFQSGGAQPHVYPKDLDSLKISVPPTVEEQQKIATVLTAADNEIIQLEQKLDQLKQEKKALMQQLLTGKRRVKVEEVA